MHFQTAKTQRYPSISLTNYAFFKIQVVKILYTMYKAVGSKSTLEGLNLGGRVAYPPPPRACLFSTSVFTVKITVFKTSVSCNNLPF